jgi:hypothetical protein
MLRSCLVSHSTEDQYFVTLLAAILRFHGVETWVSHELAGGQRWRKELDVAIDEADSLLVVASKRACNSEWVLKEITKFRTARPDAPVIPLCLDTTDPVLIDEELAAYQAVDFHSDMNLGFERLLADTYGRPFLPAGSFMIRDRRQEANDRRAANDRRRTPALQRLRRGFWKSYQSETGMSKFEAVEIKVSRVYKARDILLRDAGCYVFSNDQGEPVSASDALEVGARNLLDALSGKSIPAVHMIEAFAEEIFSTFSIQRAAARRTQDRRQPDIFPS